MTVTEKPFVPEPGQVDYTDIRYAPVLNSVIMYNDKILLVQRSHGMRLYPGYWSGVSGFLDDASSIEEKLREELAEEIGVAPESIVSIERGEVILEEAPQYNKTWIVVPVLVHLSNDSVILNWESEAARWFTPHEIGDVELLPGYDQVLQQFITMPPRA